MPNGILRNGSRGDGVKQLQRVLNAVYFKCGAVDGILGPKTVDAIRRFQMVYLPYEVDGVYGPNTRKKLQAVLKSKGY
ncbi:peptidoglycan-binding domain-containing protein [Pseudogracilibacillus auburnensis]|uniref:peptidoglycan-binding domain-containing protein n=1 Tax=Pseudogracilibacillus auburnensis TaxID=1494959 RepID=UPI001A971859|nr:peptidoglycan-binding domain-containing protein [Pseudogracilibacillus auburnensis]MBO1004979.1 peptidoglycan-binding protein [Pseudogracilibacillus auburnensis]